MTDMADDYEELLQIAGQALYEKNLAVAEIERLRAELVSAQTENARFREALGWYADRVNGVTATLALGGSLGEGWSTP